MLNLLIISNYWHFDWEKSSSRYNSIAAMAADRGFNVEVLTSAFYHTNKKRRTIQGNTPLTAPYKFTLVNESGYRKNVSVKRIISHFQFASGVIKCLKSRKPPDIIYLFVPPTGLAKKVVSFAKKYNIKIIIDIQDLWPEAFEMLLPKPISKLLLPMKRNINFAYSYADEIVAVSKAYIKKVKPINKKNCTGLSVYIGTDIFVFDSYAQNAPALKGKLKPVTMAYIGMLGHSYDLTFVMESLKRLIADGYDEIEFLVMGDGPLQKRSVNYAKSNNLPVRFTGRLSYKDMVQNLVRCDFAINVLNNRSHASIINKHADYAAAGIPMINIQKDTEFNDLILQYNAGFVCPLGDAESLQKAMKALASNTELRLEMGKNSRKLAEELFDKSSTYKAVIDLIESMIL